MKQYRNNRRQPWTQEEKSTFFQLFPQYGTDYKLYCSHLNRSYSSIKSFYHHYLYNNSYTNTSEIPVQLKDIANQRELVNKTAIIQQINNQIIDQNKVKPYLIHTQNNSSENCNILQQNQNNEINIDIQKKLYELMKNVYDSK
ncbi:Homeobox-like_domain superfamily [Hexamita inflata]|uniref:Homeobox-like domain superfamily n=1 Tax=Hexamita inflata TaxID=28002 RepID=A0AA86TL37_9EUKA|nr:Homeobox-like domain superfamily [Hexamita inflata]